MQIISLANCDRIAIKAYWLRDFSHIDYVLIKAKEPGLALLDDNSLIDLKENEIPPNRKLLEPITNETLQKFDDYRIDEIEKFICRFKNQTNHEINLNNGIKLIQIIGSGFSNKNYNAIIDHDTGLITKYTIGCE